MKKLLLPLLFISLISTAQTTIPLECGFTPDKSMFIKTPVLPTRLLAKDENNLSLSYVNETKYVFNVFFHIVNNDEGINTAGIIEDDLLFSIATLNIEFNQFNIFFKYRGFEDSLNSTELEIVDDISEKQLLSNYYYGNNLIQDDRIDIIVPYAFMVPASANFSSSNIWLSSNLVKEYNDIQVKKILIHEVGHVFGLLHTFEGSEETTTFTVDPITNCYSNEDGYTYGWNGTFTEILYKPDYTNYVLSSDSEPENVVRITTDPNYNADDAGDFVTDTPATFQNPKICFAPPQCFDYYLDLNILLPRYYIFNSNIVDYVGDVYGEEIGETPDVENYMSYNSVDYPHFTFEQIE